MKEINLSELSLENIAIWPMPIKVVMMVLVAALIIGAGYMFSFKEQLQSLQTLEEKEIDLIRTMERKQQQAANLHLYRRQLKEMQVKFGALLKQLPGKTEIPELLEEITKNGLDSGLKFQLFDPQPEIEHDFYVEVPIKIIVDGSYHQLATFISKIASMRRIVTLHDLVLKFPDKNSVSLKPIRKINGRWPLIMGITAKVYRYQTLE